MTCAHVLGLIDGGPFVEYPRAHLEAAWQHARQCASCATALEAAAAITRDLAALPQPALPADVAAAVAARIARIDEARTAAAGASVQGNGTLAEARGSSQWPAALAFVLAALAVTLVTLSGGVMPDDALRLRTGAGMPAGAFGTTIPGGLTFAAGLALYVAALFLPLAGRD